MAIPLEQLLLRYRRDGTPEALAELFDRAAPELMRVACHVAPDLGAAEDLVQATFLTAIESAADFDERRRLLPWLLGILANHVRTARRAAARPPPPPRLLPPLEPSPLARTQSREFDALVQRELDALAEPYREVAILALRHELKPAQIADALHRSPGAVRVQLHRALEQLRKRLPRDASPLALPGLLGVPRLSAQFGRGLAQVRAAVVDAAPKAVAAAALVTVGGLVVTKKLIVAAVLTAAAGTVLWKSWPDAARPAAAGAAGAGDRMGAQAFADDDSRPRAPAEAVGAALDVAPSRNAERTGEASPSAAVSFPIDGEICDAATRLPLAGAIVAFFPPRSMTIAEAHEEFAEYLEAGRSDGQLHFRGAWPRIVEPIPTAAWLGRDEVEICAAPLKGEAPLASARSGEEGRFTLAAPHATGVLVVAHDGYERQVVPVTDAAAPLSIGLAPTRELSGSVTAEKGSVIDFPVKLLLFACDGPADPKDANPERSRRWNRQVGPWLVETDGSGAFRADVSAKWVAADSATPGLGVASSGTSLDGRMHVVLRRLAVLTVIDATSGRPLEDFTLLATSVNHGSPTYAGRFHARDGHLPLETGPRHDYGGRAFDPMEEAAWLEVWSDDHQPARVDLPPKDRRIDLTVALERGAPPAVGGKLVRKGEPVAGAVVSLNAFYPLGWSEDSLHRLDECVTDEAGAFELHGPTRKLVVLTRAGGKPLMRVVELPAAKLLVIDLAGGGRIAVVVRDLTGAPRADAKVFIRAPGDRQEFAFTGEDGRAAFETLVDGEYVVSLNGTRDVHVAVAQDSKTVRVSESGGVAVELLAPPAGPVHLRIHAAGMTDYSGWRARDGLYTGSEWFELAPDGRFGRDAANLRFLDVADRERTTWHVAVTPQLLAGGVVELPVSDVGYRGRAVDRVTGAPLANAIVSATGFNSEDQHTARADADGRFSLRNLKPEVHVLSVRRARPNAGVRGDAEDGGDVRAWFRPGQPAAPGGREVLLRVPEIAGGTMAGQGRRLFRGRVASADGGKPVANGSLFLQAKFRDDDGEWGVGVEGSWGRSGADGRYELAAPRAPAYEITVYGEDRANREPLVHEIWNDDGRAEEVVELDLLARH